MQTVFKYPSSVSVVFCFVCLFFVRVVGASANGNVPVSYCLFLMVIATLELTQVSSRVTGNQY